MQHDAHQGRMSQGIPILGQPGESLASFRTGAVAPQTPTTSPGSDGSASFALDAASVSAIVGALAELLTFRAAPLPSLVTAREVAAWARVSEDTVLRAIARGDLRAGKAGDQWRVRA